jgi:mannose-6-phosphate isomerase-like protein (cupin superfamily)
VYVPVGVPHATVSLGPGNLELVTSFSPPVVPGSWDKKVE